MKRKDEKKIFNNINNFYITNYYITNYYVTNYYVTRMLPYCLYK